ncbi:hypothetical protein P7C70_g3006, partial [Phenoliferia sp. Uapishka_3]
MSPPLAITPTTSSSGTAISDTGRPTPTLDEKPSAKGEVPEPSRTSFETFDLGGDLDVERQLDAREKSGAKAGAAALTPPGPVTLAHDDLENPRNWSTFKKVVVNFVLCTWVLTLTYSSTAYVSSLSELEKRFHSSQEVALLGVTLTVLGFAAGPLLFGPSSEIFGRQAVYRVSALFYSAFAFGAAFSPNMQGLLVFRFLLGFFGSSSINNVPASIGDFTVPANRSQYSILYALMAFGGPALGPLCSSFIDTDEGFRWNLRVMAIFSTVVSIIPYLIDVYLSTAASALAAGMASRALIGSVLCGRRHLRTANKADHFWHTARYLLCKCFTSSQFKVLFLLFYPPGFDLRLWRSPGATSLLAGLALCLAPIPFIFNKYGPRFRELSKHATVQ